jgi:1-acyl-sn-glycerol-3-phosphate acyltransferase
MKILYWIGRTTTHVLGKLLFGIRITGTEHIPREGGFILASNHISYYDPPLVGSYIPRELFFFAKKELFKSRLFGAVLRRVNALPVRRGQMDREALKMSVAIINSKYGLTVFPEGTRSKTKEFLPPKPGIGLLATQAACPIVPAYIHGANRLKDCFRRRIRLSIDYGEPITAEWIASLPTEKNSYLTIAAEVMARIAALKEQRLTRTAQ